MHKGFLCICVHVNETLAHNGIIFTFGSSSVSFGHSVCLHLLKTFLLCIQLGLHMYRMSCHRTLLALVTQSMQLIWHYCTCVVIIVCATVLTCSCLHFLICNVLNKYCLHTSATVMHMFAEDQKMDTTLLPSHSTNIYIYTYMTVYYHSVFSIWTNGLYSTLHYKVKK